MEQKHKNLLLTVVLAAVLLLCVTAYGRYTQQQIYYESTQNLLSTYGQVTKTFNMFAQRNWNILAIWADDLVHIAQEENAEASWREYVNEKANWQYSEVVLFNEENQFWTVGGRQGDAPHMQQALQEVYASDEPMVTSYISSQDVRKVMFAQQIEPVTLDGVVYTSLAICYDNSALENMLGGMAYDGQSDCYIVRSNGDVVLSTEPKTEITERMDNLFTYLQKNASPEKKYFSEMLTTVPEGGKGSVKYRFQDTDYYLVYQPVGVKDWSIVGIVPTGVVDDGMLRVQSTTILLLAVLSVVIFAGVSKIRRDKAQNEREKAEAERRELQRRKEMADQMFQGMARIVDRFAVCDLDNDYYEYHERRGKGLYEPEGSYRKMVEQISRKYVIMTDRENAKLSQMLAPENLRSLLKSQDDTLKLEYASRDKTSFQIMTVVPAGWQDGRLTRVMLITQDMGEQHRLRYIANTDSLTGLLNQRYFEAVLASLTERQQSFALLYLDLDRFKPVNDTYGHTMGDRLLQQVAKRLQRCIRSADYAFRLGGDEFALLLIGDLTPEDCQNKAAKVRRTVGVRYEIDEVSLTVGTSCGYALYPAECADAEQLRVLADQRMYEDKRRNHALMDHGLR